MSPVPIVTASRSPAAPGGAGMNRELNAKVDAVTALTERVEGPSGFAAAPGATTAPKVATTATDVTTATLPVRSRRRAARATDIETPGS